MNVLALDPLTALSLEHGRAIGEREILEWFADDTDSRSTTCARVIARWNVDEVLGRIEGTLMERLELQEAVYDRLETMLDEAVTAPLASEILRASSSPQAFHLLRVHHAREDHRIIA